MTPTQIADVKARTLTLNVSGAIQAAHRTSKRVFYPDGSYYLGALGVGAKAIDLSGLGDGVAMVTNAAVEFVCTTTGRHQSILFYLKSNNNFSCGDVRFRDLGYDANVSWKGAIGFYLDRAISTWGNVNLGAIHSNHMVASVIVGGGYAASRVRGINIKSIVSNDCYYGYVGQNQGDHVIIGTIVAYLNFRAFFVYGCAEATATVVSRNNRATSGEICLASYGPPTTGVRVNYTSRDNVTQVNHVLFEQFGPGRAEISNCEIDVDIIETAQNPPVAIINYNVSGGVPVRTPEPHTFDNITLRGSTTSGALVICSARFASPGRLFVGGKLREQLSPEVPSALRLSTL